MFERYEMDWDAYHRRAQTGPCFVCGIVARNPEFPAHVIYEDQTAIVFLDKYPRVYGYTIVAPREHRAQVTGDFAIEDFLALQRIVHRTAEAVRQELNAERIYLLSLGSNQRNAHVHWHVVPLPAGVPYREQQLGIYKKGILKIPDEEMTALAARIRRRMDQLKRE
ncbi:MAG: HIT family protein [Chloroflexi bacterium]|nr:HIT family protein [Chloroflexota bacterium]